MAIKKDNKRVFVALSGGVDSAVSALLLKKQGYEVVGVFIKIYNGLVADCNLEAERLDAKKIASQLKIDFLDLDLSAEYKKHIFDYMVLAYQKGLTPNPDIFCNKFIKFGYFLTWALEQGADFVATGHYAQIQDLRLLKASFRRKDQSYFLAYLKKASLDKIIFPVGDLKKEEVRKIAEKNNLFIHNKQDSQGLCFIGRVNFSEFLKTQMKENRGELRLKSGEIIGYHLGVNFYTIGQRHGFEVLKNLPNQKRLFVIKKEIENNNLIVSDDLNDLRQFKKLVLRNLNLHQDLKVGNECLSVIRYQGEEIKTKILRLENDLIEIETEMPHFALALGQICCLFNNQLFLGAGTISQIK